MAVVHIRASRWVYGAASSTAVKYTTTHAGGSDTVAVNQQLNSGTWFKLGTYDLLPGAGHKVTISDRANGGIIADAVRVVSSSQGARVARWSGTVGSTGAYQVWGRWTAAPGHALAATYDITTPGGTESVTVDQRSGGGQWHLLQTLSLAANDNWQVEQLKSRRPSLPDHRIREVHHDGAERDLAFVAHRQRRQVLADRRHPYGRRRG